MRNKLHIFLFNNLLIILLGLFAAACQSSPPAAASSSGILPSQTISPQSSTAIAKTISPTNTPFLPTIENVIPTTNPTKLMLTETLEASKTTETETPPAIPEEHYITTITGHRQFFPLGCETSAAVDWAVYFGTVINEFEFQFKIPLSDNPDFGFVGSVNDIWGQTPPFSYGVHAAPIADVLQEYGVPAEAHKKYTLEEIKAQIAADQPVIAWVIGNCEGGVPAQYTDSQGNTTQVGAYEHVIILTGYSPEKVRYMNNGNFYEVPNEVFLNSWGVLDNMVVVRPFSGE